MLQGHFGKEKKQAPGFKAGIEANSPVYVNAVKLMISLPLTMKLLTPSLEGKDKHQL